MGHEDYAAKMKSGHFDKKSEHMTEAATDKEADNDLGGDAYMPEDQHDDHEHEDPNDEAHGVHHDDDAEHHDIDADNHDLHGNGTTEHTYDDEHHGVHTDELHNKMMGQHLEPHPDDAP